MGMTLYFKRAKSFVQPSDNDKGTKKFLAQPGPHPQPVPNWVAETNTFRLGILDGSIVDLTPPHLKPGYKAHVPEAVVQEAEEQTENEPAEAAEASDVEQTETPKAPFGAQPMTPVAPAPKVGQVRAVGKGR